MRTNNNINNRIFLQEDNVELNITPKARFSIADEQMLLVVIKGSQKSNPRTVALKNERAFECAEKAVQWVQEQKAKHNLLNITARYALVNREDYHKKIGIGG